MNIDKKKGKTYFSNLWIFCPIHCEFCGKNGKSFAPLYIGKENCSTPSKKKKNKVFHSCGTDLYDLLSSGERPKLIPKA